MEYSDKIVKLISRVIEDLINNTMEKGANFSNGIFYLRDLKNGREEHGVLTKWID